MYRQDGVEEQVGQLLEHFHAMFSRFPDMLQYYLGTVADKLRAEGSADDAGSPYNTDRVPASMSFKVAIESSWHGMAHVVGNMLLSMFC